MVKVVGVAVGVRVEMRGCGGHERFVCKVRRGGGLMGCEEQRRERRSVVWIAESRRAARECGRREQKTRQWWRHRY